MIVNPDIPEAHALRGWFDAAGNGQEYQSFRGSTSVTAQGPRQIKTLLEVKEEGFGLSDKPQTFSCRATIMHIKEATKIVYESCPNNECKRKVTWDGDGWRCEKCQRSYEQPKYRYELGEFALFEHLDVLFPDIYCL